MTIIINETIFFTHAYPVVCELYDPIIRSWSDTHILNNERYYH